MSLKGLLLLDCGDLLRQEFGIQLFVFFLHPLESDFVLVGVFSRLVGWRRIEIVVALVDTLVQVLHIVDISEFVGSHRPGQQVLPLGQLDHSQVLHAINVLYHVPARVILVVAQIIGVCFEVALLAIVRQPDVFEAPVVQLACVLRLSFEIFCIDRLSVHRLVQETRQIILLIQVLLGHLGHLLLIDDSLLLHFKLDYAVLLVLGRLGQLSVLSLCLLQFGDHREQLLTDLGF